MRIWWCQEHECSADSTDLRLGKWCYVGPPSKCRMVPMRLIAEDADLVIERVKGMGEAEWVSTIEYVKELFREIDRSHPGAFDALSVQESATDTNGPWL